MDRVTVICTDGRVIAGDGRVTAGDILLADDFRKVRRLKDGSVAGMAGDLRDIVLAFDWLDRGAPFDTIPKFVGDPKDDEDGFEALILRPDGRLEWFDQGCVFVPYAAPFAIGVASEIAVTCLRLGLTPKEAVERAAHQCVKVGGTTIVLKPTRNRSR
jgi:hypothetical protein